MSETGKLSLQISNSKFKWVVGSNSKFKWVVGFCSGCKKTGDFLISPIFSTTVNNVKYEWQLELCPKGDKESNKDYISMFICSLSNTPVEATNTFILLDTENKVVKTLSLEKKKYCKYDKDPVVSGWGSNIVTRNFILNKANNVLTEDEKLTFWCEVLIDDPQYIDDNLCKEKENDTIMPIQRLEEFEGFKTLLDDESYSDIVFKVGGNTIKAHKCIPANRSEVFAAMFKHDTMETKQNTVKITDTSYHILKEMLQFLYSGKVNDIKRDAVDLLPVADKYLLQKLKSMCERVLSENLNVENVIEYVKLADSDNATVLKKKAIEFIVSNAEEFEDTLELKTLSETHPEIMYTVSSKP